MNEIEPLVLVFYMAALPAAVCYMFWRSFLDYKASKKWQAILLLLSTNVLASSHWILQTGPEKMVSFLKESNSGQWITWGLFATFSFGGMLLWRLQQRRRV